MVQKSINLLKENLNSEVIFYDLVGKYGDWLFKQPIIFAFQQINFSIYFWNKNPFLPILFARNKSKIRKGAIAVVFTRQDRKSITETNILTKHRNIIEIQRVSKSREILKYWKDNKEYLNKIFKAQYEEERIELILKFLKLPIVKRQISFPNIEKRQIVINFNVGENINNRINNIRIEEILRVANYALKNGYKLLLIKQIKINNALQIKIENKIIRRLNNKIKVKYTNTFSDACNVIDECSYYLGVDSGLVHYAVQSGKIVFSIYNNEYHGTIPLFNTKFSNHLIFYGNKKFGKEIIFYLNNLDNYGFIKKLAKKFILRLFNNKNFRTNFCFSNSQKFQHLIIELALSQKDSQNNLKIAKDLFSGVFFPDRIWDINYDELKQVRGKIFIESFKFIKKLAKILDNNLNRKKMINIFAKNSSFFYGTALKRNVSDIDLMTVWAPFLNDKEKGKLLKKIKNELRKNHFSINLPHQVPILIKESNIKLNHNAIIKNGKINFKFKVQNDYENLEKYKSRIKLKIILNEINTNEFTELIRNIKNSTNLGSVFLEEINYLIKDSHNFYNYEQFIRRIESLLKFIGGFGSKGAVILRVPKECKKEIMFAIEGLMKHGIVYFNNNRLYINWDIRRPQNAWFIPIGIIWEDSRFVTKIMQRSFQSPIYKKESFKILKRIKNNQIPLNMAIELLGSKSYLIISEIFIYLKLNLEKINKFQFRVNELKDFFKIKNSDANIKLDKKINLFYLITRKSLKLSKNNFKKLSKYNLFVQFFNDCEKIDILKTQFFKNKKYINQSSEDFTAQFKNDFVSLLREYYLYKVCTKDYDFLEEKKKELLFNYFVKGKNLMQGPKKQSKKIEIFLRRLDIKYVISDQKYLELLLKNLPISKLSSRNGKFLLLWAIENSK